MKFILSVLGLSLFVLGCASNGSMSSVVGSEVAKGERSPASMELDEELSLGLPQLAARVHIEDPLNGRTLLRSRTFGNSLNQIIITVDRLLIADSKNAKEAKTVDELVNLFETLPRPGSQVRCLTADDIRNIKRAGCILELAR